MIKRFMKPPRAGGADSVHVLGNVVMPTPGRKEQDGTFVVLLTRADHLKYMYWVLFSGLFNLRFFRPVLTETIESKAGGEG